MERFIHAGRRADLLGNTRQACLNRRTDFFLVLSFGDVAQISHAAEHVVSTHLGAFRTCKRVVNRRSGRKAGQSGSFSGRQLLKTFAVVSACSRSKTVSAVAEEDLVHVNLKDLIFAEIGFDLESHCYFVEFTNVASFAGEEEVAGDLHRDGGGTLTLSASS